MINVISAVNARKKAQTQKHGSAGEKNSESAVMIQEHQGFLATHRCQGQANDQFPLGASPKKDILISRCEITLFCCFKPCFVAFCLLGLLCCHTWWCSRAFTPGYTLKDYSRQGVGEHVGCQGSNPVSCSRPGNCLTRLYSLAQVCAVLQQQS